MPIGHVFFSRTRRAAFFGRRLVNSIIGSENRPEETNHERSFLSIVTNAAI